MECIYGWYIQCNCDILVINSLDISFINRSHFLDHRVFALVFLSLFLLDSKLFGSPPYWHIYWFSLDMYKPPQTTFHQFLCDESRFNPFLYMVILNLIFTCVITHSSQHPHFSYPHFIILLSHYSNTHYYIILLVI